MEQLSRFILGILQQGSLNGPPASTPGPNAPVPVPNVSGPMPGQRPTMQPAFQMSGGPPMMGPPGMMGGHMGPPLQQMMPPGAQMVGPPPPGAIMGPGGPPIGHPGFYPLTCGPPMSGIAQYSVAWPPIQSLPPHNSQASINSSRPSRWDDRHGNSRHGSPPSASSPNSNSDSNKGGGSNTNSKNHSSNMTGGSSRWDRRERLPPDVCKYFAERGQCFRQNCRFRHVNPDSRH